MASCKSSIPGAKAKYAQAVEEAERRFAETLAQAVQAERDRQAAFAEAEAEHEKQVKAEAERVATRHAEVDSFRESYEQRNPEALVTYCSLVLAASQYPDAFPQQHKIAYVPESRQLVIEMDLPTFDVIPEQLEYRYVKAKDEIAAKARPAAQRKALYSRVVSQVTLRTVHEMFESDRPSTSSRSSSAGTQHDRSAHRPADAPVSDHPAHHARAIRCP